MRFSKVRVAFLKSAERSQPIPIISDYFFPGYIKSGKFSAGRWISSTYFPGNRTMSNWHCACLRIGASSSCYYIVSTILPFALVLLASGVT